MAPKLGGHVLQLVGFALVFLGLSVVAVAMFLATSFHAVPFWVFVLVAVAFGAPLMVAGGRANSVGRGLVLGMPPEEAAREYRRGVALLAVYLALLLLQGVWVAAPLVLCGAGLTRPSDPVVLTWVTASMLAFCVGRYWMTRPLMRAAERKLMR